MSNCYCCGIKLKLKKDCLPEEIVLGKFASKEHIIPNFLGAKLSSYNLLCDGCNNTLGSEIDSVLAKELPLSRILDYKRDRKNNYGIIGKTKEGWEVLFRNGKYEIYKPNYLIDNNEMKSFLAKNEKQALGKLKSIKKNHPEINLDVQDFFNHIEWIDGKNHLTEFFLNDHSIGSIESFRAICKIALNLYIFLDGNIDLVCGLNDFVVNGGAPNNFITFFYPIFNKRYYQYNEIEISNIFYLKADPKWSLLYFYVEFYNVANFLIVMNDYYNGKEFEWKYKMDLLDGTDSYEFDINLSLFRNPVYHFHHDNAKLIQEKLSLELTRVFKLLNKLRREKEADIVAD